MVERLAADLRREFPDLRGFSRTNLRSQRLGPGDTNVRILDALKDPREREWYARAAIQHGWSRNVLVLQIESGLYRRQGKALTNFTQTLPAPQSDLARQVLKDPYNFDFLTLVQGAREKELEAGLLEHVQKFLLELGVGFAFVGSQYPLEVGGEDLTTSCDTPATSRASA